MTTQSTPCISEIIRQSATLHDLLDDHAAAALLNISPGTLSVWRSTGRYALPFLKIGRKVRYRRADLEAWMEKRLHANGATA